GTDTGQQAKSRRPARDAAPGDPSRPQPGARTRDRTGRPDANRARPGHARPDSPDDGQPPIQRLPRALRQPRMSETFEAFAPCPHGLDEALMLELQALGHDAVRAGRAGCDFRADWAGVLRSNLYSR